MTSVKKLFIILFIGIFAVLSFAPDVMAQGTGGLISEGGVGADRSGAAKAIFCDAQRLVRSNVGVTIGLLASAAGLLMLILGQNKVGGILFMLVGVFLTALPGLFISFLEGTEAIFRPLTGTEQTARSAGFTEHQGFSDTRDMMDNCTGSGGARQDGTSGTNNPTTPDDNNFGGGSGASTGDGTGLTTPGEASGNGQGNGSNQDGGNGNNNSGGGSNGGSGGGGSFGGSGSSGGGSGGSNGSPNGDGGVSGSTTPLEELAEELAEDIRENCVEDPSSNDCERKIEAYNQINQCISGNAAMCNNSQTTADDIRDELNLNVVDAGSPATPDDASSAIISRLNDGGLSENDAAYLATQYDRVIDALEGGAITEEEASRLFGQITDNALRGSSGDVTEGLGALSGIDDATEDENLEEGFGPGPRVGQANNGSGTGLFDSIFGLNQDDQNALVATQNTNNSIRNTSISVINGLNGLSTEERSGYIQRLNDLDNTADTDAFRGRVNSIQAEAIRRSQANQQDSGPSYDDLF